jgi:hypothetical protein
MKIGKWISCRGIRDFPFYAARLAKSTMEKKKRKNSWQKVFHD